MKQVASLLVGQRPSEAKPKPTEGCHSRESGSPENIIELPLAQNAHSSKHKAVWIPACAGMPHHVYPAFGSCVSSIRL